MMDKVIVRIAMPTGGALVELEGWPLEIVMKMQAHLQEEEQRRKAKFYLSPEISRTIEEAGKNETEAQLDAKANRLPSCPFCGVEPERNEHGWLIHHTPGCYLQTVHGDVEFMSDSTSKEWSRRFEVKLRG